MIPDAKAIERRIVQTEEDGSSDTFGGCPLILMFQPQDNVRHFFMARGGRARDLTGVELNVSVRPCLTAASVPAVSIA